MTKRLHHLVIEFFENRMAEHSAVVSCNMVPDTDHIIYQIIRTPPKRMFTVLLSDEYFYSELNYMERPLAFRTAAYILIARPEAKFSPGLVATARRDRVGIGKIGALMGALSRDDFWNYTPSKRRT